MISQEVITETLNILDDFTITKEPWFIMPDFENDFYTDGDIERWRTNQIRRFMEVEQL